MICFCRVQKGRLWPACTDNFLAICDVSGKSFPCIFICETFPVTVSVWGRPSHFDPYLCWWLPSMTNITRSAHVLSSCLSPLLKPLCLHPAGITFPIPFKTKLISNDRLCGFWPLIHTFLVVVPPTKESPNVTWDWQISVGKMLRINQSYIMMHVGIRLCVAAGNKVMSPSCPTEGRREQTTVPGTIHSFVLRMCDSPSGLLNIASKLLFLLLLLLQLSVL